MDKVVQPYRGNNRHKKWNDGDKRFVKEDAKYIYVEEFVSDRFGSGFTDIYAIDKKDVIKAEVDKDEYLHLWLKTPSYLKDVDEFDFGIEESKNYDTNEVMFWINHIGDTVLMEDEHTKWYVKDVKINKSHDFLSEVIFIDLKTNEEFSICVNENIPIQKWI